MALPLRRDIDVKDKWKIEDLFATDELWEKALKGAEEEIEKECEYKGKFAESEDNLYNALVMMDELELKLERIYVYANQKYYEDTANAKYQNYAGMAQNVMTKFYGAYSFAEPEILDIPEEIVTLYLASNGPIKLFKTYLSNILRQKDHILSEEMENVLAGVSEVACGAKDIFSSFNNADVKFENIRDGKGVNLEVTHGKYAVYMESNDREIRKSAFESLYKSYGSFENTLASMFNANVKQAGFFAKTRKYNSSLEKSLSAGNIPVAVYENLIDTVNKNISLMHRYVNLRKKVLGVDELHMYDVYAPLVADYECKIDFEEAKARVLKGLAPLGKEYQSHLIEGYENGWIDVYENQGKRSGAFSWGAYGTHPYVFLNYQENLNNMFTLAHEMGHAMHTYYSNENQPHVYAGYSIFVAEVASTCNEALLIRHLIKESTDVKEKKFLINHFLEQFKGTMFRQTMFAEFEKIIHEMAAEGTTLTAQVLCDVYEELNKKYFGEEMVIDPQIRMEWSRIPHFYTPFYVYQYATGFAAAIAISDKILNEGETAVNGYLEFLKSGSSDYPIEVLKKAGVDLAKPEVVDGALKVFEELLDEFEALI